jgi:hypothetical protein
MDDPFTLRRRSLVQPHGRHSAGSRTSNWVGRHARPASVCQRPDPRYRLRRSFGRAGVGGVCPTSRSGTVPRRIRRERPAGQSGSGRTQSPRRYPSVRICVARGRKQAGRAINHMRERADGAIKPRRYRARMPIDLCLREHAACAIGLMKRGLPVLGWTRAPGAVRLERPGPPRPPAALARSSPGSRGTGGTIRAGRPRAAPI